MGAANGSRDAWMRTPIGKCASPRAANSFVCVWKAPPPPLYCAGARTAAAAVRRAAWAVRRGEAERWRAVVAALTEAGLLRALQRFLAP